MSLHLFLIYTTPGYFSVYKYIHIYTHPIIYIRVLCICVCRYIYAKVCVGMLVRKISGHASYKAPYHTPASQRSTGLTQCFLYPSILFPKSVSIPLLLLSSARRFCRSSRGRAHRKPNTVTIIVDNPAISVPKLACASKDENVLRHQDIL